MSFEKVPFKLLLASSIISSAAIIFLINILLSFYPSKSSVKFSFSVQKIEHEKEFTILTLDKNIQYFTNKNADFPFPKPSLWINGRRINDSMLSGNTVKFKGSPFFSRIDSISLKVYTKSDKNLLQVLMSRY